MLIDLSYETLLENASIQIMRQYKIILMQLHLPFFNLTLIFVVKSFKEKCKKIILSYLVSAFLAFLCGKFVITQSKSNCQFWTQLLSKQVEFVT